jgi:glutaredoxin 3
MASVIVYTKLSCSFCVAAKALLDSLGVAYEEIRIDQFPERREEMIRLSGRQTVPQIFINEAAVGGCDDLHALHKAGKLKQLLEKD